MPRMCVSSSGASRFITSPKPSIDEKKIVACLRSPVREKRFGFSSIFFRTFGETIVEKIPRTFCFSREAFTKATTTSPIQVTATPRAGAGESTQSPRSTQARWTR